MVFSNSVFLFIVLPITLMVYYLPCIKKITTKNYWLLFISLIFYAWGEPAYVFLMILSIIVNYFLGMAVGKCPKTVKGRRLVALACLYNLGQLFVFKYMAWIFSLFIGTGAVERTLLGQLALPIGISFYTFQALSYVIDIYRGKDQPQSNILNTGLYIAFFPQLIAGPIVRYGSIAEQLIERKHSFEKFSDGVCRFTIGLSKKLLLANQLAVVATLSFDRSPAERSVVLAWAGALCFMLQIYFDFSGYSDMAIGLGKMFGFEFSENFNYPYISKSITEYWRRWHISLGEWFRDYLFYPFTFGPAVKLRKKLSGKFNRKTTGIIASVVTLFVVWMATGIWHGANMTFVVWGLIQFVFIVWEQYRKPFKNEKLAAVIGFTSTYLVILITKVIFNSSSMTQAIHYYGSMLGLEGNKLTDAYGNYWIGQYFAFIVIGFVLSFPTLKTIQARVLKSESEWKIALLEFVRYAGLAALLVSDVLWAVAGGYNPFIYFNF